MAEKADLPSDQVSLPPNYAPSETFTDSPPPAYKRPGMAAVRVARIVCFTLLAMTFVIGFFVVTHKWVQNRECNCPVQLEASAAQHAALFAQAPTAVVKELDNNLIEEIIQKKEKEQPEKVIEDVTFSQEKNNEAQEEEESEENQFLDNEQDEIKELNKDVKLPKDLLLGNPSMAGRNVHCKVEKRQRKITEGIMTQAIIVTCDDDDEDNDVLDNTQQMPVFPIRPPLSLLSTIMKVLSSRPPSMGEQEREEEPRIIPFPGQPIEGPIPIIRPIRGPFPGPFQGPIQSPFPSPLGPIFVPLRKIEMRRPFEEQENEESLPVPFFQRLPQPSEEREPRMHIHPFNPRPPMPFFPRQDESNNIQRFPFPFLQRQEENNNVQRIPFPFLQRQEENVEQRPQFPFLQRQEEDDENVQRIPFPFPSGPVPIRVIRLPAREQEEEEQNNFQEEENEERFPGPLHPMIRFFPTRRRIIRLRPKESLDNAQSEPLPFPLSRGALTLHNGHQEPMPHPMPEASGRALPSPVALPEVRVVRLPFRPQPHLPEARLFTHMEVRQRPEEADKPQEHPHINLQPPSAPENRLFIENNKEFGPPRTHTVIENAPEQTHDSEEENQQPFHEEPITQTQSQPHFIAPPPPRFAREGRTSFTARLNPDAEVIPTQWDGPVGDEPSIHRMVLN